MAIFKRQHKKDHNGSASNRQDAGAAAGPGVAPPATAPAATKAGSLNGSIGRSGIPVPGGGGGPGAGPTHSALYASSSAGSLGNSTGPPPPLAQQHGASLAHYHHQGQAQAAPPAPTTSSHTVLYPWSQRHVSLLPSQLLPPSSPVDSPSQPLTPLIGPPSPLPFPRYGHSVNPVATASPSGDLFIFGGLVQNAVKNDLFVVHAAAAGAPPPAQGSAPPGSAAAAAAASSAAVPLPVALVETRGEVPGPRVGHASVGVGNVLIVWGGDTKSRPEERQDDGLYLLNLSTRDWTRVKTVGRAPEGRYGHAAAMVGSRFFVFGGQTDDGGFRNDLCWFDLQKRAWPLSVSVVLTRSTRLVSLTHFRSVALSPAIAVHPTTRSFARTRTVKMGQPSWSFVEYRPGQVVPPPRTGHTCVTHGDSLYMCVLAPSLVHVARATSARRRRDRLPPAGSGAPALTLPRPPFFPRRPSPART